MLKRVGILAFVLTAGALFQPAAALAQDRFDRGHDRVVEVHRDQPCFAGEYVAPEYAAPVYIAPVYKDDWNRDRFVREDRDRVVRRDDRGRFDGTRNGR